MIPVELAQATTEQLRRLAACGKWFVGPKMYAEIRAHPDIVKPVEGHVDGVFGPASVTLRVEPYVPDGYVIGIEPGDMDMPPLRGLLETY